MTIELLQFCPSGRIIASVAKQDAIVEVSKQDALDFISRDDVEMVVADDPISTAAYERGYKQYALKWK